VILSRSHHPDAHRQGSCLSTFAWLDKTTGDGAVILTNGDKGDRIVLPILEQQGAPSAFLAYLRAL
jgi:hypothetical protein